MSLERFGDIYTPTCDICGEELPGEFDFNDAVRAKKAEGWQSKKDKYGDWEDICTECQKGETT